MPDVEITTGVNASGVKTGLAQMRGQISSSLSEIKGQFAAAFAVTGLIESTKGIIEYGARVADLSARFGVSTKALQEFGNAAELTGASMQDVAQGFNKLIINQSKALGGSQEIIDHFAALNVTVEDLKTLSPEEIMAKIGTSSLNAADLVGVLGRNGLSLRDTLASIADGTVPFGTAIDDNVIKKLKAADDTFKIMGQNLRLTGANLISFISDLSAPIEKISRFIPLLEQFNILRRKILGDGVTPASEAAKRKFAPTDTLDEGGASGAASGGSGGTTAVSSAALQERLAQLQEQHATKQRADEEQLNTLLKERDALLTHSGETNVTQEGTLQTNIKLAENQNALDTVNAKLARDKAATEKEITAERDKTDAQAEKEAEQRAQAADAARAALRDSQEATLELRAQLAGHEDIAEQLKIAYGFDQKINEALAEGYTAVAAQLTIEKDLTLEVEKRVAAEKAAAAAAQAAADAEKARAEFQKKAAEFRQNLSDNAGRAIAAGISGVGQQGIGTAGATYEQAARVRGASEFEIAKARARDQLNLASGRNPSFTEQLRLNQIVQQAAAQQTQQASALFGQQSQQQLLLLQQAAAAPTLDILNKILAQLAMTHGVITPPPG